MSVGSSQLDHEHEQLLEKMNAYMRSVAAADPTGIVMARDLLETEAVRHFAYEEEEMRRTNYPDMDKHLAHHAVLMKSLSDLRFAVAAYRDNASKMSSAYTLLQRWLVPHLQNDDTQLANHIAAFNAGCIPTSQSASEKPIIDKEQSLANNNVND